MLPSLEISVAPVVRFPIGLIGGVLATLWMDQLMAQIKEGRTPPYVAASVLTEQRVGTASDRLAAVVHYFAGAGTGLLFVWLSLAAETAVGGASATTAAGTAVFLYALMVGFFAAVPLPRATGLDRPRRKTVLRAWAIAALAYLLVLVPIVTGLSVVV